MKKYNVEGWSLPRLPIPIEQRESTLPAYIFRAVGAESVELYMAPFGLEDGAVVHH